MMMLMDIVNEIRKTKSQEEILKILASNKSNSNLIWLLKVIYNPNFVVGPLKKIEVDDKKGLEEGILFCEVVDLLVKERISFGNDSDLIYSSYIKMHPDLEILFSWLQSRSIEGIKPSQINKAFRETVVCDLKLSGSANYRKGLICKEDKYVCFEKKPGSLISIVKYGDSIEVFSKNGNPYFMFDAIRKAFENVPFDGRFLTQLCCPDEKGNPSMQQFLSETARKQQSENFFYEVFDFIPLSGFNDGYSGQSFKIRNMTAKFAVEKFVNDPRASMAKIENFNDSALNRSCYIVNQDVKYGHFKAEHFMTNEIKK